MNGLLANRNAHRDFVGDALRALGDPPCQVYVAVAFFTDPSVVEHLVIRGCRVRLVVRLGYPTTPNALERLMGKTDVELRFFTDRAFHPKLYIFGTHTAVVGSANLTQSALISNQEVCVTIASEDRRFEGLAGLFSEYWTQAKVLTAADLEKYRDVYLKYSRIALDEEKQANEILNSLGRVVAGNITRDVASESSENVFLEEFRKTYQEFLSAFNLIRREYLKFDKRKVGESKIPLRLEIDSFISFIRDTHAKGEAWAEAPLLSGPAQAQKIRDLIAEWFETPWPYLQEEIVQENYPRIVHTFGSPTAIKTATDDELFNALTVVHAVHERKRFYLGGLPTWKKAFLAANDPKQARDSFVHLLYGPNDLVERMADLIYSPKYKLNEFGQSGVQELVGWINKEDLPVVNGRTTKVLRFLGFNVTQLG